MSALPQLLDRRALAEETGLPRSAIDAVFRACPTIHLPGLRKPLVRRTDVLELLERSTFVDDGTSVRPDYLRRSA